MIARGTTIAPSGFCNPDVECEIALRLHKTSAGAVYTRGSVADLIDAVFPAIEITENSYGDVAARGSPKLSADDFSHKACVLGPAQPDLGALGLAVLSGRVRINGNEKAGVQGVAVMGHPLGAVAWLANISGARDARFNTCYLSMTGLVTPVIILAIV